jgi:hypothetical protein
MQILDLVVGVELLQEEPQPGRKPGAEVWHARRSRRGRRWSPPPAPRRCRGTCRAARARTAPWRRDGRASARLRADTGRSGAAARPASHCGHRARAQQVRVCSVLPSGLDNVRRERHKPSRGREGLAGINAHRKVSR